MNKMLIKVLFFFMTFFSILNIIKVYELKIQRAWALKLKMLRSKTGERNSSCTYLV